MLKLYEANRIYAKLRRKQAIRIIKPNKNDLTLLTALYPGQLLFDMTLPYETKNIESSKLDVQLIF